MPKRHTEEELRRLTDNELRKLQMDYPIVINDGRKMEYDYGEHIWQEGKRRGLW